MENEESPMRTADAVQWVKILVVCASADRIMSDIAASVRHGTQISSES